LKKSRSWRFLTDRSGACHLVLSLSLYINPQGLNRIEMRHAPFDAAAARQDRK
jgi:hypothetical protein